MSHSTEAFARAKIDALLMDAGWNLTDGSSVLFEHRLPDGTQADYLLCDRQGRPMAALEAKRESIDPIRAQDQGRHYAEQLEVPFVFLSNGEEVRFLDLETGAHARRIAGFYAQDDLERRLAARRTQRDLSTVATDRKIVDRDYQIACVRSLCTGLTHGRRKWRRVLDHFDGIQLGLTATPCMSGSAATTGAEDDLFVRDTLRFFEVDKPTFRYSLGEAVDEGHLVPYRIHRAMTVKTAAEGGFRVARSELDWSTMDAKARSEFERLFARAETITVDPKALERSFTIPERNRAIVREFRDAHEQGLVGRDGVRRWPRLGKTRSTEP